MDLYDSADVHLNRHGLARWRSGHPWVYRAGVAVVEETTGKEALARLLDPKGRFLGQALLSRESKITLRRLTDREEPVTRDFLARRIERAITYRERVAPGRDAVRLVFGEADGLPGLVVDRYGPHLVLQTLSWGMDALQPELVEILKSALSPQSILARNDPAVRTLEGLSRETVQVHGETPERVSYHLGDLVLSADLHGGQKTGAYLDQHENCAAAARMARGRVLDMFTYTGSFALSTAASAEEVVAVDSSKPALARAREHAARNGIENVRFAEANAFDFLKQEDRSGARYALIVLDPPALAKNKREIESALRGYKELNLRAMKILEPGGTLVTCSCSYHLSEPLMEEMLTRAAADVHRRLRVIEKRRQAADHPVLLGFPESLYLKCMVLEALD